MASLGHSELKWGHHGSINGSLPIHYQSITWTNDDHVDVEETLRYPLPDETIPLQSS